MRIDRRVHHAHWLNRRVSVPFGGRGKLKTACKVLSGDKLLTANERQVTCSKCKAALRREKKEEERFEKEWREEERWYIASQKRKEAARAAAIAVWWEEMGELPREQLLKQLRRDHDQAKSNKLR